MPIDPSLLEETDAVRRARGTANSKPRQKDRGLVGARPIPDEHFLEKWAKARGGALDFVPTDSASSRLGGAPPRKRIRKPVTPAHVETRTTPGKAIDRPGPGKIRPLDFPYPKRKYGTLTNDDGTPGGPPIMPGPGPFT